MLVVDNAQGTIWGGQFTSNAGDYPTDFPPDYLAYFAYYAGISPNPGLPPYTPTVNGIAGYLGINLDTTNFGPGVVVDLIDFHSEGEGDAVIQLWSGSDLDAPATWSLADTVTVHVPEPITLTLLGLGGLFLRRRK